MSFFVFMDGQDTSGSGLVRVTGFISTYRRDGHLNNVRAFHEKIIRGKQPLEVLIAEMHEQRIHPASLYASYAVPARDVGETIFDRCPEGALVVAHDGLHDFHTRAREDRQSITGCLGAIMIPFSLLGGALLLGGGESPLESLAVAAIGPAGTAALYGFITLGQHFGRSGKSKAFITYLETQHRLAKNAYAHEKSESGQMHHFIDRKVKIRRYCTGADVRVFPSWKYEVKHVEIYVLAATGLGDTFNLALGTTNGFDPVLYVGFMGISDWVLGGEGQDFDLNHLQAGREYTLKKPITVSRADYDAFQKAVDSYGTLIVQ